MRRIFFLLIAFAGAQLILTPTQTHAVDSTGGRCFCDVTVQERINRDHPLLPGDIIEQSTKELGEEYATTDESSCTSACEQYADDQYLGSAYKATVTETRYTYPSEADTQAVIEAEAEEKASSYLFPNLNVDIPGLTFSDILQKNGKLQISFLPEYINGLYRYLLGAGAIIAIVMIMIGGAQYILGSGLGSIEAGKKRITNAVTGLVLLLAAFTLLYIVNPSLTEFGSVEVELVDQIRADLDTSGAEGTSGGAKATNCEEAIEAAQLSDSCPITQSLLSPPAPIRSPPIRSNAVITSPKKISITIIRK